ncbi:unnamed protein product [Moneuplotes crassus]|uniref:EF-hand domain-containing protein n=1 Tax=Euplotes crassus TaxID=5936 RepID=A0AAD2D972_EUPCR|nr:unnamed protein product [Moneuplotes crassus]
MAKNDQNLEKMKDEIEADEIEEFKKFKVHHLLNNINTINWMRKRASEKAQIQYLNNSSQLEEHQAIVRVFEKFDDDGNGTLEVEELKEMFDKNHIDISANQLLTLFSIVDEDKSGALDINEFKEFALSMEANKHFRDIIKELRYKETYKHIEDRAKFLPFNFSTLLNFLSDEAMKDSLRENIEPKDIQKAGEKSYSSNEVKEDLKRFIQLFKSEYSNQASTASDPLGRQINTAVELRQQKNILEKELSMSPQKQDKDSKASVTAMDLAKLKISAMRRSTIRRQGSTFDLDKIKNKVTDEVVEDSDELMTSSFDTDSIGSDGSVHIKIPKKITTLENSYEKAEKEKLQKKTHKEIQQIIKKAKKEARASEMYYKEKYGKPEKLCGRRSMKDSTDFMKKHKFVMKNKPKLRKVFYKQNKNRQNLRLKNQTETNLMKPTFNTATNFFSNPTPNSINFQRFPLKIQEDETETKSLRPQLHRQSAQSTAISPSQKERNRIPTASTEMSNCKPHHFRNVQSVSSIKDSSRKSAPKLRSTVGTPYQVYRLSKKTKKRPVFVNQLIPSKNKILASRNSATLGNVRGSMKVLRPSPNTECANMNLDHRKKFIHLLGDIDPTLKKKTLLNFKKMSHLRIDASASTLRRGKLSKNLSTLGMKQQPEFS